MHGSLPWRQQVQPRRKRLNGHFPRRYVNENYLEAANALQLDRNDIIQLAQNSFIASSLSTVHKQLYLHEIERYSGNQSN